MKFHTIADYKDKLAGKKVLVRVDTNATLEQGRMPLTERVKAAFATLRYLLDAGASVIAAGHNGRAGEASFVSLGPLFLLLKQQYPQDLPDMICPGNTYDAEGLGLNSDTIKQIKALQPGQLLILENVRFLKNETAKLSREQFSQEKFVQDLLGSGVDHYVLDGFSVAHRAHMSVVGFPQIPNLAGLCLHKELEGAARVVELLQKSKSGEGQVTFLLGGAKIQDYLELMEKSLANATVGKILTGGLLGQICLFAKGIALGDNSKKPLEKKDSKGKTIWAEKERIANLLAQYPDRFELPIDVGYELADGSRKDYDLAEIPAEVKAEGSVFDIGPKTVAKYKEVLAQSTMAYWKGPLGAFDKNSAFATGSQAMLELLRNNDKIFSVMGGGDTGQMLQHFGAKEEDLGYVSLSGGALIEILAGKKLPGIAMLEASFNQYPL